MGLLTNLYNNDFKSFKEDVKSAIYSKISDLMSDYKENVASNIFKESDGGSDDMATGVINGAGGRVGGEFLVDVDFLDDDNDTQLRDFRIAAPSEDIAIHNLESTFGKGRVKVFNVRLNNGPSEKTDVQLGKNDTKKAWKKVNESFTLGYNGGKDHIASHPKTSPETLHKLAEISDDENVHRELASNPNTSSKTLHKLAEKSDDKDVLRAIAKHKNASSDIKKSLNESSTWGSEDEKPSLRLIKTHTNGNRTAKVYKDNNFDEHRVRFFTDGKHHKDADYFETGDKDGLTSAHTTAKNWVSRKHDKKVNESEHLEESLSSSDPIKKWIDDFTVSDNPRFEGKSKEERRKMAIGAFYASKKK